MTAKKEKEEGANLLVPLDWYLKSAIHIGTKYKDKSVEAFIYKTKQQGIKILDVQKIDERLKIAGKFLAQYAPQDILIVCRRETGYKAVKKAASITGMKRITGRYLPGILTNPAYEGFFEPKLIVVCDPWPDRQVIKDARLCNIPIVALVGSSNSLENVDYAIPCNNKSKKSLPLVFWILGREYLKNRGLIKKDEDYTYKLEDFTDEDL
ncbi:30S ribosomal protein S2 [Candidatus Tiddalikarchaeum anstoanum]|nr:30S ribosomal protein S2 [Candidatus Tiddalikarchaeum anstoanum]